MHEAEVLEAAKVARELALKVSDRLDRNPGDGHSAPCPYATNTRWLIVTMLTMLLGGLAASTWWAISTYNSQSRRSDEQDKRIAAMETVQAVATDRYVTLISMVGGLSADLKDHQRQTGK